MKKFLTLEEQQEIINLCFEKGEDKTSGFYKPKVLVWNKLCQMKINQVCICYSYCLKIHYYNQ